MADLRAIKFLLVEDDDAHATIAIRSLQRNGQNHLIHRVGDGAEALRYLRRQGPYADEPRPDIVLLDLNLPVLSGHEVLEIVKKDADLRTIPVVILTTSGAESDRLRAYKSYANSYLVKPIDFNIFRQLVRDLGVYWGIWNCSSRGDVVVQ